MWARARRIFAIGAQLLALACAANAAAPSRPNFLLISIDTLCAGHLGAYGYERPTSPNLDRFAAEGVLYENAVAQSPWTLPSHASLLTGLYTRGHGLTDDHHVLASEVPVLSEILSRHGYRTGAVVNSLHLLPRLGLVRLMEFYRYFPWVDDGGRRVLSADGQIDAAVEFLSTRDERPFFLFFHSFDVHSDYLPSDRHRKLFERPYHGSVDGRSSTLADVQRGLRSLTAEDAAHLIDLYDAAIHQLDERLQRLFEYLDASGLRESTLVIVVSDHGEEFLDHGSVLHGRTLYEEMLRVPLLVRGPGVPAGVRVRRVTPLVDVAPTVLALAGAKSPRPMDGRDLRTTWSDPEGGDSGLAFADVHARKRLSTAREELTAVRSGPLKLIFDRRRDRARLFDVVEDPEERHDRADQEPEATRRLLSLVRGYLAAEETAAAETDLSPQEIDLLRRLGYAD